MSATGAFNTSPAHAETYYKMEEPGDPATVTGSPRPGIAGNGWTQWFLSWPQWLRGSATGDAVVAGPNGSSLVSPASLPGIAGGSPLNQPRAGNANANTWPPIWRGGQVNQLIVVRVCLLCWSAPANGR